MPGDLITCEYCSNVFELPPGKGQRRYCSDTCRKDARARRHYPDREYACKGCGRPIERERRQRTERCRPCRRIRAAVATRAWIEANPDKMRDLWAKGKHKRRALLLALPSESISPREIHERDGWTCGICTEPIDRELSYPDPMSPSLDHVVPLSRGGHHVRTNVQSAHLLCNVIKNDYIGE